MYRRDFVGGTIGTLYLLYKQTRHLLLFFFLIYVLNILTIIHNNHHLYLKR